LGLEEPIDKKAGRIPGAINRPWFEGLNAGYYKPSEIQKQRFSEINPEKEIIVYCGSGVTAAPNFLALKEAGFEKVKLYLGSFSDWISYQENKIE
jgi:thiosulfate/3-mercaptopyruvate sulfurtransferase